VIFFCRHLELKDILNELKERCNNKKWPFPKYFYVDNADQVQKCIKSIFPDAAVLQDLKHLINRLVECLSKGSKSYTSFSMELHSAFTSESCFFNCSLASAYHYYLPVVFSIIVQQKTYLR